MGVGGKGRTRRRVLASALAAVAMTAGAAALNGAGAEERAADRAPRVGDGAGGFEAVELASFDSPVYVHGPKGANGLVFVVEQDGVIRMMKGGEKLAGAFLDISDKVQSGGEEGLLSVAFSPFYENNRRFYVYFTDNGGDITVQEYRTSRGNPRDAEETSARTVIEIDHPGNSNHNGGQIQFGPDGDLYIGTGDGGSGGDPPENAQNKDSLLGKMLRIDPRRTKGKRGYTIPRSNPFVGRSGADEIYSLGLRNPFRFSFDRKSGAIAIGDVGQDSREEIDYEARGKARGANFGWDAFEGNVRYTGDASPPPAEHERPILDYPHNSGGCAVTGGYVVRDRSVRSLYGRYIYADFCKGDIRSLVPRTDGASGDRSTGLPNQSGLSSFGEDSRGRIYFTNLNSGKVFQIR
jgi:glucose/arabinose dehydrogenase